MNFNILVLYVITRLPKSKVDQLVSTPKLQLYKYLLVLVHQNLVSYLDATHTTSQRLRQLMYILALGTVVRIFKFPFVALCCGKILSVAKGIVTKAFSCSNMWLYMKTLVWFNRCDIPTSNSMGWKLIDFSFAENTIKYDRICLVSFFCYIYDDCTFIIIKRWQNKFT